MLNTPVLSTSSVACGLVVRTPTRPPAWNTIEFPNVLLLVQIGMKCGVPGPKIAGALLPLVGGLLVVFVDDWAKADALGTIHSIETARILDFMTSSFSKRGSLSAGTVVVLDPGFPNVISLA